MTSVWVPRQEDLVSDGVVSPHVFEHMVDRLCDCVVPSHHCLETGAGKRNVHLSLGGLLSHVDRKHAEEIAARGRCGNVFGGVPQGKWRVEDNLKRRGGPCLGLFPWPRFPSYPQAR